MKLTSIKIFTLAIFFLSLTVPQVMAVTTPSFPSCSNSQGSVKANYSEGTHGIVGSTALHTGSDTVYTLTSDTLMQCFCADDGSGIQTNWWNASSLNDTDIQVLKNQGWYLIPNGALWGLASTAYVAKNSDYSCRGGIGGGDVLSGTTRGDILGLAATGDAWVVYSIYTLGLLFIVLSVALKLRKSRTSTK